MKRKILIVDCNLKMGGIQKALVSLLNELHDVYEVDLLLLFKHGPLLNEIPEDVHVIETKSDMRYMGMAQADCKTFHDKLIRGFYALLTKALGQEWAVRLVAPTLRRDRSIQKNHYDLAISYSHIANSKLFYGGTAEYVIRAVAAKKKACYLHCDYKSSNNASKYSNRLYSRFDHIVCVSESTRRHLIEMVPEIREKTCTIYNPIDTDNVRYLAGQSPVEYDSNYLNLLTVARLTSEKGVARFVHALGIVANEKIRYYVVGSGRERAKIEQEIELYGLQNRVFLVGEQDNPYRYIPYPEDRRYCTMDDWKAWIREIAYDRIDQIERQLNASPDAFPEFAAAAGKLDAAMDETDAHPDAKLTERDDLWMTYSAALALEMYLAGTRDGGRVYHAFITGELPAIQNREEDEHEQNNT